MTRHCRTCGRVQVRSTYSDGHDRHSGEAIVRSFWKCPRSLDSRPLYLGSDEADCYRPDYRHPVVIPAGQDETPRTGEHSS